MILLVLIISDKADLLLSKWSNDYGANWLKGVFFTLGVNLYFLSLGVVLFDLDQSVEASIHFFFQLLNITNWSNFKIASSSADCLREQKWFYPYLFISRIFISYGIYQTVQAFRRYGKTS